MKKENPIKREIILILIGAAISGITALTTNIFNSKLEHNERLIEKKFAFNDSLSRDLGERLSYTLLLKQKSRNNRDTMHKSNIEFKYNHLKLKWNRKIYTYRALVRHYYGKDTEKEFDSIYFPLVKLGHSVEYNFEMKNFEKECSILNQKNIAFIAKIFDKAEQ